MFRKSVCEEESEFRQRNVVEQVQVEVFESKRQASEANPVPVGN